MSNQWETFQKQRGPRHTHTCGLGLGNALLTEEERGISDPERGGLIRSKLLLLLSLPTDGDGEVAIPGSTVTSDTVD